MRRSRISLGPGAASLILIIVILSMSVPGILSLMNARNDMKLSGRSAQVIESVYALQAKAEESLAALDAKLSVCAKTAENEEMLLQILAVSLPEGMTLDHKVVAWTETDGLRTLECRAEIVPENQTYRLRWTTHRLTAVTEDIWN
jgi:hypothetical protein